MSHTRRESRSYVFILYGSQSAPLLLPWLKEAQGTSLAMVQGKAPPVPAHILMFRVPTVLLRVLSRVLPKGQKCAIIAPLCVLHRWTRRFCSYCCAITAVSMYWRVLLLRRRGVAMPTSDGGARTILVMDEDEQIFRKRLLVYSPVSPLRTPHVKNLRQAIWPRTPKNLARGLQKQPSDNPKF